MKAQQSYVLIGDELLIAVFNKFPKGKSLHLKNDIMLAFYKASKKPAYAELFENYRFDEDGAFPYSQEIGEGLEILEGLCLLSTIHSNLCISKGVEIRFNKSINPRLNEKQRELLQNLSDEIKQHLL